LVVQEELATPGLGDVLADFAALGHRVDVGVDTPDGNVLGGGNPFLRIGQRHLVPLGVPRSYLYCAPEPTAMSMPYRLAALRPHSFSRCSADSALGSLPMSPHCQCG